MLTLLPDSPRIYDQWKRIVTQHGVQGVKVYDARLVAVMNLYSLDALLTFNTDDFKRYANISALHPSAMLT
jgi:predicted nucleic acid-binding protein